MWDSMSFSWLKNRNILKIDTQYKRITISFLEAFRFNWELLIEKSPHDGWRERNRYLISSFSLPAARDGIPNSDHPEISLSIIDKRI